ncbi:MAG: hypothetical protein V2J20_04770 [Wenzhouxiangella sp.]|jgi:hypothetical protein|nr:hypothetical protein [Wenzhouxiangella sp.]
MKEVKTIQRGYRAVRLVHTGAKIAAKRGIGKAGSQAAVKIIGKANVVIAVADAALSLAELACACLELVRVREETKQLEETIRTEEERLAAELEILKMAVSEELTRLADRRKVAAVGNKVREQTFAILEAVRRTIDDLAGSDEVAKHEKYQQTIQQYEIVARRYDALTDELYG